MPEASDRTNGQGSSAAGALLATSVGVVAGGVATSGPAIAAAGAAGGLGAYGAGLGVTIAAVGCEAAALGTLLVVAAGPILGGLVGYSTYKLISRAVQSRRTVRRRP